MAGDVAMCSLRGANPIWTILIILWGAFQHQHHRCVARVPRSCVASFFILPLEKSRPGFACWSGSQSARPANDSWVSLSLFFFWVKDLFRRLQQSSLQLVKLIF
jgi:hypothetical protein